MSVMAHRRAQLEAHRNKQTRKWYAFTCALLFIGASGLGGFYCGAIWAAGLPTLVRRNSRLLSILRVACSVGYDLSGGAAIQGLMLRHFAAPI